MSGEIVFDPSHPQHEREAHAATLKRNTYNHVKDWWRDAELSPEHTLYGITLLTAAEKLLDLRDPDDIIAACTHIQRNLDVVRMPIHPALPAYA